MKKLRSHALALTCVALFGAGSIAWSCGSKNVGRVREYEEAFTVREVDTDSDGSPEQRTYYRDGKPFLNELDTDDNGKIDSWWYLYEERLAWTYSDSNEDGKEDFWMVADSSGKPVFAEGDADGDGKADEIKFLKEEKKIDGR